MKCQVVNSNTVISFMDSDFQSWVERSLKARKNAAAAVKAATPKTKNRPKRSHGDDDGTSRPPPSKAKKDDQATPEKSALLAE